ncbi:heme biosynthesis operon protein HemX [Pseudomonas fulva]|uniref:uroporphyrinogen-III C-methyltransferase n=1 Tax=Pseudomonas TaxID=286 RepID=UPI000B50E2D7|nr:MULTISPECIES: uroporphyrinogen-III C-methyltransferase [Pseudomonas]MCP3791528.1 uroporphyrinogen-III C-methyltransferase [Pseudomonas sp. N2-11]HCP28780.1 heme biosynthesis operon protein HemX [Pseudomonas sp.]MBA1222240.1 heme biosynthesis operon protein HemX [Pseudomonas fulva]TFA87815.1 uroporphyrin-3 C-methyltransferase [Pseudomonas sp. URIL14HWK12:I1]SNB81363.1 uroporphyrin-3 C-methyltransferase [Pseudomonas sp. LAIL14HWK12:I4]
MSETVLSNKDQTSAQAPTEPVTPVPAKRSGNGLAALALLLGAAGIAVGGWGAWQVHQLQGSEFDQGQHLEALNQRAEALQQREQKISAQLAGLPAASELEDRRRLVAQLQGDQQRLSQRLETVLGESRKEWRLAEAEHLLRLATLRLSALQDITSAKALVEGADEILREQSDPGAFAAREQLARSLATLNNTQQPDRTGLFLELAAQRELVQQLSAQSPEFDNDANAMGALTSDGDGASRLSKWWSEISKYFQIEFNADENVKPLLAGQQLNQLRLALSLTLEQAQWAALNGDAKVYAQALDDARSVLLANFNADNPQSKAMLDSLNALAEQPVSVVTPDLSESLASVQAYIQRRHLPGEDKGDKP